GRGAQGALWQAGRCESPPMTAKINLDEKFGLFSERWRPKIIAAANGQEVKIVKVQGEFPWHHHDVEDEFFYGLERPVPRRVPRPYRRARSGRVRRGAARRRAPHLR